MEHNFLKKRLTEEFMKRYNIKLVELVELFDGSPVFFRSWRVVQRHNNCAIINIEELYYKIIFIPNKLKQNPGFSYTIIPVYREHLCMEAPVEYVPCDFIAFWINNENGRTEFYEIFHNDAQDRNYSNVKRLIKKYNVSMSNVNYGIQYDPTTKYIHTSKEFMSSLEKFLVRKHKKQKNDVISEDQNKLNVTKKESNIMIDTDYNCVFCGTDSYQSILSQFNCIHCNSLNNICEVCISKRSVFYCSNCTKLNKFKGDNSMELTIKLPETIEEVEKLRKHLDAIERNILEPDNIKKFNNREWIVISKTEDGKDYLLSKIRSVKDKEIFIKSIHGTELILDQVDIDGINKYFNLLQNKESNSNDR